MRALVLLVLVGCKAHSPAPPAGAEEIDAFRTALADNAKQPLRQGLKVDEPRLRSALEELHVKHHDLLDARFRASLDALPRSQAPAGPVYGLVTEIPMDDMPAFAETTRLSWLLEPDASRFARVAIGMTMPMVMSRTLGLAMSDVGAWMAFLQAAKPTIGLCDRGPQSATLCVDYGGLDVFVVTVVSDNRGWHLGALTWQQRGRAPR